MDVPFLQVEREQKVAVSVFDILLSLTGNEARKHHGLAARPVKARCFRYRSPHFSPAKRAGLKGKELQDASAFA